MVDLMGGGGCGGFGGGRKGKRKNLSTYVLMALHGWWIALPFLANLPIRETCSQVWYKLSVSECVHFYLFSMTSQGWGLWHIWHFKPKFLDVLSLGGEDQKGLKRKGSWKMWRKKPCTLGAGRQWASFWVLSLSLWKSMMTEPPKENVLWVLRAPNVFVKSGNIIHSITELTKWITNWMNKSYRTLWVCSQLSGHQPSPSLFPGRNSFLHNRTHRPQQFYSLLQLDSSLDLFFQGPLSLAFGSCCDKG